MTDLLGYFRHNWNLPIMRPSSVFWVFLADSQQSFSMPLSAGHSFNQICLMLRSCHIESLPPINGLTEIFSMHSCMVHESLKTPWLVISSIWPRGFSDGKYLCIQLQIRAGVIFSGEWLLREYIIREFNDVDKVRALAVFPARFCCVL